MNSGSNPKGLVELEGRIMVSEFDIDGSILAVDLIDFEGQKYLVADNLKGEHLIRHVGKKVFVTGRIINERTMRIIEVDSYSLI